MLVVGIALGVPATACAHDRPAGVSERALQRMERAVLGPEHAAEHAHERRALRHARSVWRRRPARERRRILARAAAAARSETARVDAAPDQVGRWESARIPFPTYAINAVVLPTGRVLFWGRSPLDKGTQTRVNDTPAYVWDPAKGAGGFTEVRPPKIDIDGDGTPEEAPLFCSGQSLLPSGEVLATGGNLAYPVYASDGSTISDFKGLNRAFTFDPWTLKWTEQPAMRKGRWYPTQALLADGRIAILAGWDEAGGSPPADNPDLEVFTPSPVRGGRGTMTRYANAARPNTSYYPHLFTMPDGRLLLGGSEPGESALLDPARLSNAAGAAPAWTNLPDIAGPYRYSASAVLLPAGPAGSSRVAILGGLQVVSPPSTNPVPARRDAELIDTRSIAPAWHGDDSVVPPLNTARSYFNVVLLPDGSLASVGGAAGKSNAGGSPPPLNSYTGGSQELKHVELLEPGSHYWTVGPAQRKWRTYHSVAALLPDGRVLSAGDDYWDMDDQADPFVRQGPTAGKPLDEAEIYEPPYLFDGTERAPRPAITGGPAAAAWGDDARRPGERGARPAGAARRPRRSERRDPRRRHEPAPRRAVRARPRRRQGPQRADARFVDDRATRLVHAVRARQRGDAIGRALGAVADRRARRADAHGRPAGGSPPGEPRTPVAPAVDRTAPRPGVRARPLRRGARTVRLLIRSNEPARIAVRIRAGRRTVRARVRLTRSRLQKALVLRLRAAERRRLADGGRLTLRVTLAATDAGGNSARRTVRLRLRIRKAATG